jgi:hypothetical protein
MILNLEGLSSFSGKHEKRRIITEKITFSELLYVVMVQYLGTAIITIMERVKTFQSIWESLI